MKKNNQRPRPNQKAKRKDKIMKHVPASGSVFDSLANRLNEQSKIKRIHIRWLRLEMSRHIQTSPVWKVLKDELDVAYSNIPAFQRAR